MKPLVLSFSPGSYVPDFLLLVDDGKSSEDTLHLVVEIKDLRDEQDKVKKEVMEVYWIPGVNNLKSFGRWAFAELTSVWTMESDLEAKLREVLEGMISGAVEEMR